MAIHSSLWSAVLALAAALVVASATPVAASHEVTPARVAGEDRYETAAEIARLQFPQGASTAVVATARHSRTHWRARL